MPSVPFNIPVHSTSILAAYSGTQSWSVRVSLEWRCKLCVVPCEPLSPNPFLGSRFMCCRHSSTRLAEDTRSNGCNIISFPFNIPSLDPYLHMHRFCPCQLVIPFPCCISHCSEGLAQPHAPNLLRLMPLPLFLTPVHARAGSKQSHLRQLNIPTLRDGDHKPVQKDCPRLELIHNSKECSFRFGA